MSPAAARRLGRHERHVCLECHAHPARFQYRKQVRADRNLTLCFRCFRAQIERNRARLFFDISRPAPQKMSWHSS
jgi:hypothetical protein